MDWKRALQALEVLVDSALLDMTKTQHVSVNKVFQDNVVNCKQAGITSPHMLYSLLHRFCADKIAAERYPLLSLPGVVVTANHGIRKTVEEYVRSKKGFCTLAEIEDHFVKHLGYRGGTVWCVRQSPDVLDYLSGVIIHKDTLGWSPGKQEELASAAMAAYDDSLKVGQVYGTVDQILEAIKLPSLDNMVLFTPLLIAGLLEADDNFVFLGNAKNAYVPRVNAHGIKTLADLVCEILKAQCGGASNFGEFVDMLVNRRIVLKSLTQRMLGTSKKVAITGNEIMMAELLDHA